MSSDAREKILAAAARLFAVRGYAGTGVRDLAREAGVALSMVNYHFGSKSGVVCELLDRYFVDIHESLERVLRNAETVEARLQAYVKAMVTVARRRPDVCRLVISESSMETPDIATYKAKKLGDFRKAFSIGVILSGVSMPGFRPDIVGPAVAYATLSNFVVGPVLRRIKVDMPEDDAFYAEYIELISAFILNGINGFVAPQAD